MWVVLYIVAMCDVKVFYSYVRVNQISDGTLTYTVCKSLESFLLKPFLYCFRSHWCYLLSHGIVIMAYNCYLH